MVNPASLLAFDMPPRLIAARAKNWAILPHSRMALCKRGWTCECKLTARPMHKVSRA
jgi:hypothetical protein